MKSYQEHQEVKGKIIKYGYNEYRMRDTNGVDWYTDDIWRDIPGYEGLYKVSNKGKVYSMRKNRNMKLSVSGTGYFFVRLWAHGSCRSLNPSRLVAMAFIPNPENKPQVNHIDGNKFNNTLENLEWCTRLENVHHAWRTGLYTGKGEKAAMSKLTTSQVIEIRNSHKRGTWGFGYRTLAKKYDVSREAIKKILTRKTWAHIP